jgi:tellurite resistance-related uncharacterized protein
VPLKGKVKKTHHHKTPVTIQEKHGKKWKPLGHTKTTKKGTFKKFEVLKGKTTVTIRAKAKGHGTSATQKVTLTKASNGNGTPTQPGQPAPGGVTPGGGSNNPPPPPPPGPTAPGAPASLTVTRESDQPDSVKNKLLSDQVKLEWTAPANNGGAAITGYTVTGGEKTVSVTSPTNSVVISHLKTQHPYTFNVTAQNKAGTSAATPAHTTTNAPDCTAMNDNDQGYYRGNHDGSPVAESSFNTLQDVVNTADQQILLQGVCSGIPDKAPQSGLYINKNLTVTGTGPGAYLVTQPSKNNGPSNVVAVGDDTTKNAVEVTFEGHLTMNGWTQDDNHGLAKAGGVMYVSRDATVTIDSNVTLNGGYAEKGGSIYNNAGTLNLKGRVANGNAHSGGGIYNGSVYDSVSGVDVAGTVNLNGGRIETNHATSVGGGIDNHGEMTITGGTIETNTALNGGGIYNHNDATVNITGGSITRNESTNWGGGIWNATLGHVFQGSGSSRHEVVNPHHGTHNVTINEVVGNTGQQSQVDDIYFELA